MHRVLGVLRWTQPAAGQRQHPSPIGGVYVLKEPFLLRVADDLCVKEHSFTPSVSVLSALYHRRAVCAITLYNGTALRMRTRESGKNCVR